MVNHTYTSFNFVLVLILIVEEPNKSSVFNFIEEPMHQHMVGLRPHSRLLFVDFPLQRI